MMPIIFELLDATEEVTSTEMVLIISMDAREQEIAAGTSETEMVLRLSMDAEADQSGATEPEIPATVDMSLYLSMESELSVHITSETEQVIDLSMDGYLGNADDSFTEMVLRLGMDAYTDLGSSSYAFLVEQPAIVVGMAGYGIEYVEDGPYLAGSIGYHQVVTAIDSVLMASQVSSKGTFRLQVADAVSFFDLIAVVMRIMVIDGFVIEDLTDYRRRQIIAVIDLLLAEGVVDSRLTALEVVSSALAMQDLAAITAQFSVEGGVDLEDVLINRLRSYHEVLDAIEAESLATMTGRMRILVEDASVLDDEGVSIATMLAMAEDGFFVTASLQTEDGKYLAWVVNPSTRAAWMYDNFGFNSFAKRSKDGEYYGAKDDGVYILEGEDDDGENIEAMWRTGAMDLGTPSVKGLPMVYLMLSRSGRAAFKVVINHDDNGQEVHWYEIEGGATTRYRQDRVKPDKGLETVEFEFEMINIDGSDFEIDYVKALPQIKSRRI